MNAVYPIAVNNRGRLAQAKKDTCFENGRRLWHAVRKLEDCTNSLRDLGFTGKDHIPFPDDPVISQQASRLVMEAVYAGEELLFFDRRLCMAANDSAYGFRHQKDILEHWDRYSATHRIASEIHQLVKDIDEMLSGYDALIRADQTLIVDTLDLPDFLAADFRQARDLFSVGFDETALLIAGRGLERVLRKIADSRKISLQMKKLIPASEADTYDLIEAMYRVKWKATGVRVISQDTKMLLHYLRTLRNGGAHPSQDTKSNSTAREAALLVSNTANRLWNQVSKNRARLEPKTVQKDW
ncbi:MAG TPA: hypothetical protein VKZ53_17015 [Candidatus Angelobacter sp.]|nr:hypothetical protein [Candidatus Angelobacter sp.]